MWYWNGLACLLTVLLLSSAKSQQDNGTSDDDNGPILISLPIGLTDQSDSTDGSVSDGISSIAKKLNCTKIEIKHKGDRIDRDHSIDTVSWPTTTPSSIITTPEDFNFKTAEVGNDPEYDNSVTSNPENEVTEKPRKDEGKTRSKRTTEDVNPSKNVTIHHNYSIVKKYPTERPELEKQPDKTECTAPFYDNGDQYNWYQIIISHGGGLGLVNATWLTPNVTQVLNPCERPIRETDPPLEDLLYKYELIEFEKVYRREEAYLRFAGTDSKFLDIHGHFVWSPPGYRRRYYRLEYWDDDTGTYIQVHRGQKCVFFENPVSVKCSEPEENCVCTDGGEFCYKNLPAALTASLVGG